MATHWKSRRLAARALKIFARHRAVPAIGAYETSLGPKANAFITTYDTAVRYEGTWRKEMTEGRGAMAALLAEINAWKPHVARERPGYDLTTIGDRPAVPEDLIQDGIALAEQLESVAAPWAAAGATALRAKATDAERETDEAAAADAQHSANLTAVRAAQAAFDGELQLLRDTLRATIGRSHPDFQKLRAEKVAAADSDDDPAAPPPSPPVEPAPAPPG